MSPTSGRTALERVFSKIDDLRRDAKVLDSPEGAKLVRASKDEIARELGNHLSKFCKAGDKWFDTKENGIYSIIHGPYNLAVYLSLSNELPTTARTTELVAQIRLNKESYNGQESELLVGLTMIPFTTAEYELLWADKSDSQIRLKATEVVSIIEEKLADQILKQFENARGRRQLFMGGTGRFSRRRPRVSFRRHKPNRIPKA